MATEVHRSPVESDWHEDGLNAQPDRSERFKTGLLRFIAIGQRPHFAMLLLTELLPDHAIGQRRRFAMRKEPQMEGAPKMMVDGGYLGENTWSMISIPP